jgi:cytochrome b6-f complex iron-sulfur subunit
MDRKEFLTLLGLSGGGLILASCLGSCNTSTTQPAATRINANFTLDLNDPANATLKNRGGYLYSNGVIVAQTVAGTYIAVAAACTHQGTFITYRSNNNDLFCPNHGSTFSTGGTVVNGPATTNLQVLNAVLAGTSLHIYS